MYHIIKLISFFIFTLFETSKFLINSQSIVKPLWVNSSYHINEMTLNNICELYRNKRLKKIVNF